MAYLPWDIAFISSFGLYGPNALLDFLDRVFTTYVSKCSWAGSGLPSTSSLLQSKEVLAIGEDSSKGLHMIYKDILWLFGCVRAKSCSIKIAVSRTLLIQLAHSDNYIRRLAYKFKSDSVAIFSYIYRRRSCPGILPHQEKFVFYVFLLRVDFSFPHCFLETTSNR